MAFVAIFLAASLALIIGDLIWTRIDPDQPNL